MKICIYTDPHWCTYSSIFNMRGNKYSKRLENLIESINFVQTVAKTRECDRIICLGDFHDKNMWTAEELTALNEIKWANIKQQFLVGNHELVEDDTDKPNSANIFKSLCFDVIDTIRVEECDNVEIVYLPYMKEENRKQLTDIECDNNKKRIVFSHNDIKTNYGWFESKIGYEVKDIESFCDLFINGHIHNAGFINDKKTILNLGNLTGLNFSEDGFKYQHYIAILDTDTLNIEFILNPHAVYFYNIVIQKDKDIDKLNRLEKNSIVAIKVNESLWNKTKLILATLPNVITYRKNFIPEVENSCKVTIDKIEQVNHLVKLREFCIEKIGNLSILNEELEEVCR